MIIDNKKKVLFVLPDLSGGGAERVTLDLINNISKKKFKITLFLLRKHGEFIKELPENINIQYGILGNQSITNNFLKIIRKLIACTKEVDLVVGSLELKGHLFSTIAARKCKKPIIGWLHKHLGYYLNSLPYFKRYVYKSVTRFLYKRMDKVVTVSKDAKESVATLFPEFEDKVLYIYNPIDVTKIEELSNEECPRWFNEIKLKPIILGVGRLEYQKGFDVMIKAFAKSVEKGYKGTLIILGEGSLRNDLLLLIDELNLNGRVLLPGFANPYSIMRNSDVVILSSRYEGLPTVLIEALVLDKQIISTDCPSGPREILKEGQFGALVKPENIDELSKEMNLFFELKKVKKVNDLFNNHDKVKDFKMNRVCANWEKVIINT